MFWFEIAYYNTIRCGQLIAPIFVNETNEEDMEYIVLHGPALPDGYDEDGPLGPPLHLCAIPEDYDFSQLIDWPPA